MTCTITPWLSEAWNQVRFLLTGVVVPLGWQFALILSLWLFREPITHMLKKRKLNFSREGIAVTNEQTAIELTPSLASFPANTDAYLQVIEDRVKSSLPAASEKFGLKPEAILLRALAEAYVELRFERLYRIIWGSQIALLRALSERGSRMPKVAAQIYFDTGRTAYPQIFNDYTFDGWVQFLVQAEAISVEGDSLVLQETGRRFLQYMIKLGLALKQG